MKTFVCLLLAAALVATACAYPASSESKSSARDLSDDAEFIVVPLEHQKPSYFNRYPSFDGFDDVVDTADFPQNPVYFPSYNPFSWHFSSYFDDLIKRVRDRFAGSWNPFYSGGDFVPSGPGLWPVGIPDDSSEPAEKNTTSTVKVIDGHKVIVNDTYYTKKTDFGTSVFKVRVIEVKSLDEDDEKPTEGDKENKPSNEGTVETGNRTGAEEGDDETSTDESTDKKEAATDAPKRDTEIDSSDEEANTADEKLNAIDSDSDIDSPKKDEVNTESGDAASTDTTTITVPLSTATAIPEE